MTDLTGKFSGFEGQIGTNHTEIMEALNEIISDLGGAPTTPTTTLADVVTALSTINSNIVGMRAANVAYYASSLDLLDTIATNIDTIINNNSLNAQRFIAAILSTSCPCDTTNPLLPNPLDVTPTPLVNDAKCRRIQFYLSLFSTWLFDVANYGSSGAAVGLAVTGAEGGAVMGGIPGAVIGAILGLIVGAVYLVGGSQLVNWANDFSSPIVQADLLAALYAATNADEGQTAFQVTVGDHFDVIPAGIINALWWTAWSNDLYSDTPEVDDSAFDGSICAPEATCWTYNSSSVMSDYGPATAVLDTSPHPGATHGGYSPGQDFTGDYYGWTITPHDSNLYVLVAGIGNMNITSPYTFDHTTGFFPNGVAAFEFELCQPE